jgi:hypothetical protein
VSSGDVFSGSLNVSKAKENVRELNVRIEYQLNDSSKTIKFYRIS